MAPTPPRKGQARARGQGEAPPPPPKPRRTWPYVLVLLMRLGRDLRLGDVFPLDLPAARHGQSSRQRPVARHHHPRRQGPADRAARTTRKARWCPCRRCPPMCPNAFIAIEDRRFRDHFGIDPIGMVRAAIGEHDRPAMSCRAARRSRSSSPRISSSTRTAPSIARCRKRCSRSISSRATEGSDPHALSEPRLFRRRRVTASRRRRNVSSASPQRELTLPKPRCWPAA